jgi:DNA polymerase-3 subunit gamma/tau
MVLVRLAYTADLPSPADLARRLQDGAGMTAAPASAGGTPKPSRNAEAEAPPAVFDSADDENPEPRDVAPQLKSFEDVVALAETKRDMKLKHALLEQVRLVQFKPGTIEVNPLPQAPRDLTQELMRKLKMWTGRVWIVAVSDETGADPLGVQRRAKEAREIETIREHPAVKEVMQHFPGARIAAVRPTPQPEAEADVPDEPDELKEDGTTR